MAKLRNLTGRLWRRQVDLSDARDVGLVSLAAVVASALLRAVLRALLRAVPSAVLRALLWLPT